MHSGSFLSKDELQLKQDIIKQRQKRLLQARQESKEMSAALLERMKTEARKKNEEIENQMLTEIRNYHMKELEQRRQQYEKCISEINQQHYLKQINFSQNRSKKICGNHLSNPKIENSERQKENKVVVIKKCVQHSKPVIKPKFLQKSSKHSDAENKKEELPKNIVLDSDENDETESKSNQVSSLNMDQRHKPSHTRKDIKQSLNSKQSHENERSCCHRSLKSDVPGSAINNSPRKNQIDERYNHLVHDRIRILEQKDKMLSRQTLLVPDTNISLMKKPPRFSEYFAHLYSKQHSKPIIPGVDLNEEDVSQLADDISRVELKKKLLVEELKNSDKTSENYDIPPKTPIKNYSTSKETSEIPSSSSDNKKESFSEKTNVVKKSPRKKLCPSPIPKNSSNNISSESEKNPKITKSRHCKKKLRTKKDVMVTVSNTKTMTVNSGNSSSSVVQNYTASRSSIENDSQLNCKAPVKVIVNVLSSENCKIEIKKDQSEKQYIPVNNQVNAEKVKNWRKLFQNTDKMTESSYYSPPDAPKKIEFVQKRHRRLNRNEENRNIKDVGYYVRKLLLMSPESIENLDVSSCNTTTIDEPSTNSTQSAFPNRSPCTDESNDLVHSEFKNKTSESISESEFDSENLRQILLKCLKSAISEQEAVKLPTFESMNSPSDFKISNFSHLGDTNVDIKNAYPDLIAHALQRLLPLYQNSFDENLETTIQSVFSRFQEEGKEFTDDSLQNYGESFDVSTSAYLQKFVSSLSPSDKRDYSNILNYLKQNLIQSNDNSDTAPSSESSCDSMEKKNFVYSLLGQLKNESTKSSDAQQMTNTNRNIKELSESEFMEKLLEINFPETNSVEEENEKITENYSKISSDIENSKKDESLTSIDVRKDLRSLGINWMDTTIQRTLEASAINSTSSGDSAGVRYSIPGIDTKLINENFSNSNNENSKNEHINLSPIVAPDLRLSLPQFSKK